VPDRSGDGWDGEPGDVRELRGVSELGCHPGPHSGLDTDDGGHHVTGHEVLRSPKKAAHQGDRVEAVAGEHHVVSGGVGDEPSSPDPVELG